MRVLRNQGVANLWRGVDSVCLLGRFEQLLTAYDALYTVAKLPLPISSSRLKLPTFMLVCSASLARLELEATPWLEAMMKRFVKVLPQSWGRVQRSPGLVGPTTAGVGKALQ